MDDALSDRQIICRIFRWFQPRTYEETGAEKQEADEGSTYPNAVGKPYAPVKQVIQHDRMDHRSERGSRGDETHCERTTFVEIMRYRCHGRDVQKPLSDPEADPLGKEYLSFRLGEKARAIVTKWRTW